MKKVTLEFTAEDFTELYGSLLDAAADAEDDGRDGSPTALLLYAAAKAIRVQIGL